MTDTPTPPKEGDRRQATVLFADVSGFTALSQTLDPEDVKDVMNGFFRAIERIVQQHGGAMDKIIGDCAMALFGAPQALEEAAKMAVNAAIEMRKEVGDLIDRRGFADRLDLHVGINSGLVVTGPMDGDARNNYTVIGPAVNLASRLLNVATAGQVVVGGSTHRYTRRDFEYRPTKPLEQLKGIEGPTVAYLLLSREAKLYRSLPDSSEHGMVGRARELRAIEERLHLLREKVGGVISIVAENGMGKSRLLAESRGLPDGQALRIIEGRSLSLGRAASFHPFVDLLRHWAGIGTGADAADAARLLSDAMVNLCGEESRELLPLVKTVMAYGLDATERAAMEGITGEALEKLVRRSIRRLFERVSEAEPVVLVFEDLHWMDESSLGLLEVLLPLAETHPILFLNAFRPGYDATSERILAFVDQRLPAKHLCIRLEPLSGSECDALMEAMLGAADLPHAMRRRIKEKTEGNPFYIEEVLRSLIDQGALVQERGRLVAMAEVEIPGTIEEVVLSRVDRLDEATRNVLQVAAVVGRRFHRSTLEMVAPEQGDLTRQLEQLIEKQFMFKEEARETPSMRRGLMETQEHYVFRHALTQDAVYGSLLKKTRRELHGRCAETFEKVFEARLQEAYGMLAYHWTQAERLEKAEPYLLSAGEEAARTAASAEALHYFREAYRVYLLIHGDKADVGKKAFLEKNIGTALLNTGRLTESIDYYDRALEFLGAPLSAGGHAASLRLARDLCSVLLDLYLHPNPNGKRPATEADIEIFDVIFKRFRALTTSDPKRLFVDNVRVMRRVNVLDPKTVGEAWQAYTLGSAAFSYSGASFAISRRFLDRAARICQRKCIEDVMAMDFTRFTLNYLSGQWAEEPGIDDEVIEQALRRGIFWDVNSYLGLECDRKLRMGRFDEAEYCLEKLNVLGGSYGYEFAVANHDGTKALLLLERRQLDEALALNDHYLEDRHEGALRVRHVSLRAKIHLLRGDRDAARADLETVKGLLKKTDVIPPWHMSMYTVAQLRLCADDLREGSDRRQVRKLFKPSLRKALNVAERVASVRAETYRLAAYVYWALGDSKHADAWWDKAIAESKRLDAQPDLARVLLDRAHCWAESPSSKLRDSSAEQLQQCREICERIGMPEITSIPNAAIA